MALSERLRELTTKLNDAVRRMSGERRAGDLLPPWIPEHAR
jgi:hypothetical protein